jgi:glycosyltransferase involved in cell wall biosynthesis
MLNPNVTIVIVARNAEATIERCVRSAVAQGGPILLVDDHSEDDTVARARAIGGSRLKVVSPACHETVGRARQAGIEAVTTRFAMWIDADDEALPGRVERLKARLEREGSDLVYDAADLHDGATGTFIRHMPIPAYLQCDPSAVRQFERNVIPSLGWPLVRMSWAARVGYDPACHGVEDYDFLLRSVMEGARISCEPTPGYRQFAYPTSVSRELANRRAGVSTLLKKHQYGLIRTRYQAAGYNAAVTAWALVAVALYREDWPAAARFLDEAALTVIDPSRVLEVDGPCLYPEGWRLGFYRGTLALLTGQLDIARDELSAAHALSPAPESANNLGVALARFGLRREADALFRDAAGLFPGYLDASENLTSSAPSRITTHPLRSSSARTEYSAREGLAVKVA